MTMAKSKTSFFCGECGANASKWTGQCPECRAWNTMKEFVEPTGGGGGGARPSPALPGARPEPLARIKASGEKRLQIGIEEFDRVLGGGLTTGSAVLIGGDPGIGKSTLLMEALSRLSEQEPVLYISGEESAEQLKMRADRMEVSGEKLLVLTENRLETALTAIADCGARIAVIDSIQTMAAADVTSAAGSVTQVRESAARLIALAKSSGVSVILVGHVTKDGQIAGPRILEHMVDTVLYFEGDRSHAYRILRAVKNRFGPANEIGVFEMTDKGLRQVENPSELFLSERAEGAAGSVVFPGMEGTRPLLTEIQALVAPSVLPQPRRTALGLDAGRLAMLNAVLEKRLGLGLFDQDIFLNVAGGLKVNEPAADLAVVLALAASRHNVAVDPGLAVFGEVGLSGEIRGVGQAGARLKEAAKLGFNRCILPAKCRKNVPKGLGIESIYVGSVVEAVARLSGKPSQ